MEKRYYLIYGPITLGNVTGRFLVGYIRIVEANGRKHLSVIKSSQHPMASGGSETVFDIPEVHYDYPLQSTFETVVHDAMQRAYENEGLQLYAAEYYPNL